MKKVEEKIIMFDSPEAAVKVNMDLWKSSDGRLAITEETARYNGCTHKSCECGGIMKKGCILTPANKYIILKSKKKKNYLNGKKELRKLEVKYIH